jgi:thermostable 8-oxoguanine DNA glycosylase
MGATIIDSILQAGLNYRYVVYPRVKKLLQDFPYYITTCDFIILMKTVPLLKLINWHNEKKPLLIEQLAWFFFEQKIENEDILADWLNDGENINLLSKFKGIGFKTIDYLKMLSGNQAIAVDRHLFKFLSEAGIAVHTYQEANQIYCKTAEILKLSKYELDRKIWLHMSKSNA